MIKAALFDLDGTLLDTRTFILKAYEHVFALNNRPFSTEEITAIIATGKPLEECYSILLPDLLLEELLRAHRAIQTKNIKLVQPFRNIDHVLATLVAREIKTAVITTRRKMVFESLTHTGLIERLDVVITRDDVDHPKPHPEGILRALEQLGVPAAEGMMVGDTPVDIQAGKAAGVATVGAVYGYSSLTALTAQRPDYLLEDIEELLTIIDGIK